MRAITYLSRSALVIVLVGALTFVFSYPLNAQVTSNWRQEIYPITECNDGIDNDGDGAIDFGSDPDCTSWLDDSESPDPDPPEEPEPDPDPEPEPGPGPTPTPGQTPVFTPGFPGGEDDSTGEGGDGQATELPPFLRAIEVVIFEWTPLGTVLGVYTFAEVEDLPLVQKMSLGLTVLIVIFLLLLWLIIILILLRKIYRKIKEWYQDQNQET